MNAPANQDAIFRAQHVGAAEVAALFDCSPWLTHFELWHRKKGTIATPDFALDERMKWGILLEPIILDEACARYGWEPIETPERLSNGNGLGGHPDRFVRRIADGKIGCVEAKAVDWLQFKKWGDEPPLNYLLQPQSYCGLGKVEWCAIVALVGGNQLEKHEELFRPGLYVEIERRVAAFWDSVRAGKPPKPDYTRDKDTLSELYADAGDTLIDLKGDNLAAIAAAEYQIGAAEEKAGKARKEAAQAELIDKLGEHGVALIDGFTVRATRVAAVPDRTIAAADIGSVIKGRKAYRRLTVKESAA